MNRLLLIWLVLLGMVVLATGSVSEGATAARVKVLITERGRSQPQPGRGVFVLQVAAGRDTGVTRISPGPEDIRVNATEFFYGKHGQLTIAFDGVRSVGRNGTDKLHGRWRILAGFGTGLYKTWKGGGSWTGTENGNRYSLRFAGFVTRSR